MRKLVALAAALAVGAALAAAPVAAGTRGRQVVEGHIRFLAQAPPHQPNACFPGITRNLMSLGYEEYNGYFGYAFDIDKSTWGHGFVVEATAAQLPADLDVAFYKGYGEPYPAAAPENKTYETRSTDPERGEVPPGMTKAIICMYRGHEADFRYTAGRGIPVPKTEG